MGCTVRRTELLRRQLTAIKHMPLQNTHTHIYLLTHICPLNRSCQSKLILPPPFASLEFSSSPLPFRICTSQSQQHTKALKSSLFECDACLVFVYYAQPSCLSFHFRSHSMWFTHTNTPTMFKLKTLMPFVISLYRSDNEQPKLSDLDRSETKTYSAQINVI